MDYKIKEVSLDEIDKAFELVLDVFLEFDAPDYSEEGVETFKNSIIYNNGFRDKFKTKDQIMLGAYIENEVIGIISISTRNHISLLFVDKNYMRKGIASKLIEEIIDIAKARGNIVKLNSSIYAHDFYKAVGFRDIDKLQEINGIRFIPMELNIES